MRHAALQPRRAAHFEHVAEIGGEVQRDANGRGFLAVIGKRDAFEQPVLPQQPDALDMDRALRNVAAADTLHWQVGEVAGEQHIVLAERGAEQRCLPAADRQPEFREHARVIAEEPVAGAADIAIGIGDGKTVTLLKREQPMRLAWRGLVKGGQGHGGIKLALVELCHPSHLSCLLPAPRASAIAHEAFASAEPASRRA